MFTAESALFPESNAEATNIHYKIAHLQSSASPLQSSSHKGQGVYISWVTAPGEENAIYSQNSVIQMCFQQE